MDAIDIRGAAEVDLQALSVVAAAAYAHAYAHLWTSPGRLGARLQRFTPAALAAWMAEPGVQVRVPVMEGAPVGFMGVRLRCASAVDGDAAAAELQRLYLLPNAVGRGLGRRLALEAEALARADGAPALWLRSMADGPARAAYARWGFREIGASRLDNDTPHLSAMVVLRKEIAA